MSLSNLMPAPNNVVLDTTLQRIGGTLTLSDGSLASRPSAAALGDGGFAVAFNGPGLVVQRFSADGFERGPAFRSDTARDPVLAAFDDGRLLVGETTPAGFSQFAGALVLDEAMNLTADLTLGEFAFAGAAITTGGDGIALAYSHFNVGPSFAARAFDVTASAVTPRGDGFAVDLFDGATTPRLIQLSGGGLLAAYEITDTFNTGERMLRGQLLDSAGDAVGDGFIFASLAGSTVASDFAITATDTGGFAAAWVYGDATGRSDVILGVFTGAGVAVDDARVIDSNSMNVARDPAIATRDGGIVVAWSEARSDAGDLVLAQFDAMGSSGRYAVDETAGEQRDPSLAVLADGRIAVAFTDLVQGRDGFGDSETISSAVRIRFYDDRGTFNGTSDNDTLASVEGSADGAAIFGFSGNDSLTGGAGDDQIDGGAGADTLAGGGGSNTLSYDRSTRGVIIDLTAGQAFDGVNLDQFTNFTSAIGSAFDDTFFGGPMSGRLEGGAGNDRIFGGPSSEVIFGGDGDDFVDGGGDSGNQLSGGNGVDTVSFASETTGVLVNLNDGTVENGIGTAGLNFAVGFENVIGTRFDDTLIGTPGGTISDGGGGVDTLIASGGGTVSYAGSPRALIIDLDVGQSFDGVAADTLIEVNRVIGSEFADRIFGSETLADTIDGGGGADTISGGGGGELLNAGTPDAVFIANRDVLSFATSASAVTIDAAVGQAFDGVSTDIFSGFEIYGGSAFADRFFGSNGDEEARGGAGADTLAGGMGRDTLDGGAGDDLVRAGNPDGDDLSGGDGFDTLTFAESEVGIRGRFSTLQGNIDLGASGTAREATRPEGAPIDTFREFELIIGSAFVDNFIFATPGLTVDGGAGADIIAGATVTYASSTRAVTIDVAAGTGNDGVDIDLFGDVPAFIGSNFNDTILGGAGDDILSGGRGGADTLDGRAGINTLSYADLDRAVIADFAVGRTFDGLSGDGFTNFTRFVGSNFNDTVFGGEGAETLAGGLGNDLLNGEGGNDRFFGGEGSDIFNGGVGSDTLDFSQWRTDSFDSNEVVTQAGVSISLAAGTALAGGATSQITGVENATGSVYGDLLVGDAGANVLDGLFGTDTIEGGAGDDLIIGDRLDTLAGGAGADRFKLDGFDGTVITDFAGGAGAGADRVVVVTGTVFTAVEGQPGFFTVVPGASVDETIEIRGDFDPARDVIFQPPEVFFG